MGELRSHEDSVPWTCNVEAFLFTRKFREDNVMNPLHGLHRLPSTTAGFRSTFSKTSFIHGDGVVFLLMN